MEERFYQCGTCSNLMFAAIASGITPHCCGKEMTLLHPNLIEGKGESHLPVVEDMGNGMLHIKVGEKPHPMTPEHSIRLICVETSQGFIIRYLDSAEPPEVTIRCNGSPKAVLAYCNLHGLWRKDLTCCKKQTSCK